jgi:hypothetical protein
VGSIRRLIMRSVVVLPEPLVPNNTSVSPFFTSKETWLTATVLPKCFEMFCKAIIFYENKYKAREVTVFICLETNCPISVLSKNNTVLNFDARFLEAF